MHGGMKTYRGSPAAARNYVEADRGRADDYYLAEGTGIAERYVASPGLGVERVVPLTGPAYEAWVAGVDPETGAARGRLRHDDQAVRFVEVTVNGPKSWSLAAELHPEIAAAYDAAQDRAATQIIGWLGEHATTRVGPRGAQVQVPVEQIEAVTVRHYTSRAGDPHRHLHLQINARVFAAGGWRALHTVGVRDSLDAINGIGHAAVATDPQFRAALATHGFTLGTDGEIEQLAGFVGAFSARAAQIGRNIDRYEADWITVNPGRQPGPALRRAWDARAWADARPDKVVPQPGQDLRARWLNELVTLGYRHHDQPVPLGSTAIGALDRDAGVDVVLTRLAARRSAWNSADVRGEVEQLLARRNVVADARVRGELAEDLVARVVARCVPLLTRTGAPEHIRALTSQRVLDVENDLTRRLAARGSTPVLAPPLSASIVTGDRLDAGQAAAAHTLAGRHALVVIEGAAGTGKTTMLSASCELLAEQHHRLTVVTPTLKAARVAQQQIGTRAGSAAWLAFQYGFRWDEHGHWTRLENGEKDSATGTVYDGPTAPAMLHSGDVLVVDEAGMLDQDTARALLTIADEQQVRVALLGDRHQLSAVGRGGVLDLAARWAAPEACLTLDTVHRFTCDIQTVDGTLTAVPDTEYSALTLAMRAGQHPGAVFDALIARGQIRLHRSDAERQAAIADSWARERENGDTNSDKPAIVADTRDQVADLNAAIRDRLVVAGRVVDDGAISTAAGQRIGVGDRVATRRNDRDLDVANRDTWTVTHIDRRGALTVAGEQGQRHLPADYVTRHVELAYASTAHGVQGGTAASAHVVLGEHTGAASAYVGMTRGCRTNVAHLVADELEDAREQWTAVFARDRADLGPGHARREAEREAARYAEPRPIEHVIADLRAAWDAQAAATETLAQLRPQLEGAVAAQPRVAADQAASHAARARIAAAQEALTTARERLVVSQEAIDASTDQIATQVRAAWDEQRPAAQTAARRIQAGSGHFGRGRADIAAATEHLEQWARSWQPVLDDLHHHLAGLVGFAGQHSANDHVTTQLRAYVQTQAVQAHPEHCAHEAALQRADADAHAASRDYNHLIREHSRRQQREDHLATPDAIERLRQHISNAERELAGTEQQLAPLHREPAVRSQHDPDGWLAEQHAQWRTDRERQREQRDRDAAATRIAAAARQRRVYEENPSLAPDHSRGIGR
jgi:exodeoxyribonuclease V alpha subunit